MTDIDTLLAELPRHIDASCVQAQHGRDDLEAMATAAREYGFIAAHVLPTWVRHTRALLAGTNTVVGSPVGFPAGGTTSAIKLAEARELIEAGAQEIDVVIAIGRLRSGELNYVTDELAAIVDLGADITLRALLEVGHLSEGQIRDAVDCALAAGMRWVKTGTGWSGIPTTVRHIEVIADQADGRAAIKAAGGVRDLPTLVAMAKAGVSRFGLNVATATRLCEEAARMQDTATSGVSVGS